MPIIQAVTTTSGISPAYHLATTLKVDMKLMNAVVHLVSYHDEASYLAGCPLVANWDVDVPIDTNAAGAELALTTLAGSPFFGGEIASDQSVTLGAAQDRAWSRIKAARDIAEAADFTCDGHVYQGDRERIMGAVMAAKIASDAGSPFSTDFTLSNNDTVTLDAAQMINVGLTLMATIEAVFAHGRAKRIAIYAAGTVAAAEAITWFSEE